MPKGAHRGRWNDPEPPPAMRLGDLPKRCPLCRGPLAWNRLLREPECLAGHSGARLFAALGIPLPTVDPPRRGGIATADR